MNSKSVVTLSVDDSIITSCNGGNKTKILNERLLRYNVAMQLAADSLAAIYSEAEIEQLEGKMRALSYNATYLASQEVRDKLGAELSYMQVCYIADHT